MRVFLAQLIGAAVMEHWVWRSGVLNGDPCQRCQQRYAGAIKDYYAPKTLKTMDRGFRTIHRAFVELKKDGRVSTTIPRKLTMNDIAAFTEWMRRRKTRNGTSLAHAT